MVQNTLRPDFRNDQVEVWIFDLDNTLYRATSSMIAETDELMGSFISDFLQIGREEARRVQKDYFRTYGLTLRGLMIRHGLDPHLYMQKLSQLDLSDIRSNPRLASAIDRLPGRKIIHTNAFSRHVGKVLSRLGLTNHFDAVFDIADADYIPKPAIEPYEALCRHHDVDPGRAVMFEDIARNLEPAAHMGMTTIWLRTQTHWASEVTRTDHIDHVTDDLTEFIEKIVDEPQGGSI